MRGRPSQPSLTAIGASQRQTLLILPISLIVVSWLEMQNARDLTDGPSSPSHLELHVLRS